VEDLTGKSETTQVFNPKLIAAVIAAGIVAFGLFMVLTAYAGELRNPRSERANAISASAIGFKGIIRLIELGGGEAPLARSIDDLYGEDLVVLTPEPNTSPEALGEVLERRPAKATLIILPKWRVMADPKRPGWVRRAGTVPPQVIERLLSEEGRFRIATVPPGDKIARGGAFMPGFQAPLPDMVQTISGNGVEPLIVAGRGQTILAQIGNSPHYVLSDPDLLSNQALDDPAQARAALELLAELNATGAEAIWFDLTLNGFARSPSALKLAFEPPFLPLTLALALAALLAGLHGAFRFGPAAQEHRAIAFGKGALVENSANLLKLADREASAGAGYAELIREATAHESGAHLALRDAELDAYLDRLSPPDRPKFSALVQDARCAEDRFDLVAAARALFQWKKDLIK
jgi:hypothetical protein